MKMLCAKRTKNWLIEFLQLKNKEEIIEESGDLPFPFSLVFRLKRSEKVERGQNPPSTRSSIRPPTSLVQPVMPRQQHFPSSLSPTSRAILVLVLVLVFVLVLVLVLVLTRFYFSLSPTSRAILVCCPFCQISCWSSLSPSHIIYSHSHLCLFPFPLKYHETLCTFT